MKKLISYGIASVILASSVSSISLAKDFTDVPDSHWGYSIIKELTDNNIISGYEDGTFKPSNTITKAEYIKLLVGAVASKQDMDKMTQEQASSAEWFEPYFNFAKEKGLFDNEYSLQDLKTTVTRNEMVNFLIRFANLVGLRPVEEEDFEFGVEYEIVEGNPTEKVKISDAELLGIYGIDEDDEYTIVDSFDAYENVDDGEDSIYNHKEEIFSDIAGLSEDEQDLIIYAYELGIVNGYDDGTFKPEREMNRAEVASIIYKFTNSFTKVE